MPHVGVEIPATIANDMRTAALKVPDTDWHLPLLYDMAEAYEVSVLSAQYSRYVIDLNRPPDDVSLYPGQDTTGICPVDTFDRRPIYLKGRIPNEIGVNQRVAQYWQQYHDKLAEELRSIRARHGIAILWDAHSIASHVPRFFSGKLGDLNFGTADGRSCQATLQQALMQLMQTSQYAKKYSYVFNGRFKGGYITRHYGQPANNIHALQLELSQCTYMQEKSPYEYDAKLAQDLQLLLGDLIATCLDWASRHKQI